MENHMLLQHHQMEQQNHQQPIYQQRQQLAAENASVASPSTFASLIQQDIPECRHSLRENHVNLKRLGDYCKANYLQKQDRDLALDETKQFAQQALASVAYQLNAYAFNLTQLFDFQFSQITDIESEVRYLSHLVTMHREKVARREIGVLTTNKVTKREPKIVPPAQPERVQRYHRQKIDYSVFDDIGHGVRPAGNNNALGKQALISASSSGGGGMYAPGSVALRGQQPQHRDSVSSSGNPSPLPWMPMMQFDNTVTSRQTAGMNGTGTLGRRAAGRALGGDYVGVVQVPQLIPQQRYPDATMQDSNGNYSSASAAYQRSISNAGDMQYPPRNNSMTSDHQSNSVAFPHLVQQQQPAQHFGPSTSNMLPTGRVDYSDATLLPAHRRGAAANNHNNSSSAAFNAGGLLSNPYLTSINAAIEQQQYEQSYHLKQQQQHIMPPPPLMGGDPSGIVQSHYASQRQVFSHMPPAAFGTLHHQNSRTHQQAADNGISANSHYMPNSIFQQNNPYQYSSQQSQDTLVGGDDGYSNGSSSVTAHNNSSGSAASYNASTISVPPSVMQNNNNNYNNIMSSKYASDDVNQKFSQPPQSVEPPLEQQQSRATLQPQQHHQPNPSELTNHTSALGVPRLYLEKVVAIYDYTRMQPDELEFKEGQVIYVLKKNEDGWFEGVLDGIRGLFPGNYVETIALGPVSSAPPPPMSAANIDMGSRYNNGNVAGYAVAASGQSIYR